MDICKNSRQMPKARSIISAKDYCDLLYAWIQCNSERVSLEVPDRRISKGAINFSAIERDFTRVYEDGTVEKVMGRATIKKYFLSLVEGGLIKLADDGYYYLTVLPQEYGYLVEYNTLLKLMNVMQRRSISIYIYLLNRYCANGYQPFIATRNQIKEYLGICTNSSNNDGVINDTLEILKRLGLMDMQVVKQDNKTLW